MNYIEEFYDMFVSDQSVHSVQFEKMKWFFSVSMLLSVDKKTWEACGEFWWNIDDHLWRELH